MYLTYDDVGDPIQFCYEVIGKEVKLDDKLVRQVFLTMLSSYTQNPINLAINAPTGEGKSYIINKVADLFPRSDVVYLTSMTDKSLFHRKGTLVVKNDNGVYQNIEEKITEMESEIESKESEVLRTSDKNLKQGLNSQIKELQKQNRDVLKDAVKLIDLNHKVLIFGDTPRHKLLEAIMSLLSHDRYEVEYEYVDTFNGIKTKNNILRGFPTVIFTAAIDYSKYARWDEIQRRFIITNPKMTAEKYKVSIHLKGARFGLPDFVYEATVVSAKEKEKATEIIRGLKDKIQSATENDKPNSTNVFIPFIESIEKSLPNSKASDITTADRLFHYLTIIPVANIDARPRLITKAKGDFLLHTCPFALFEDLVESVYLMEIGDGVRPYHAQWFNEIFLAAFNEKAEPSSKNGIEEESISLTTRELVAATNEIQKRMYSTQQIYENYIVPLINAGYIDRMPSNLDKRSYVFYPVMNAKQKILLEVNNPNNFAHDKKIQVADFAIFPSREYLISKIKEVLRYSYQSNDLTRIEDHEGKEVSVEELVDRYFSNPEDCFESLINKSNE
jgi:hypothetical protein